MSTRLTEKGKQTILGLVSSICHGLNLTAAAQVNGLETDDEARVMLYMLLVEAGLVPELDMDDFE